MDLPLHILNKLNRFCEKREKILKIEIGYTLYGWNLYSTYDGHHRQQQSEQ